jgi:diguanylate cyclase (GGDEF)-like protein
MGVRTELDGLSKPMVVGIGIALTAVTAWADYLTGPAFSFAIFYLIPIYFVTWYAGLQSGLPFAFVSLILTIVADSRGDLELLRSPLYQWDRLGKLIFYIITVILLARLRAAYKSARDMSRLDFLTGVANTREFYKVAETERQRSLRYNRVLSVAFLDLDGFKQVNDKYGHSVGDKVLMAVADTLSSSVRATDLVARIGGDEFVVLLPETDEGSSRVVMSKIQTVLTDVIAKSGWGVTFSIGVVTFTAAPVSLDAMIRAADQLMYSVKNSGKNRIAHAIAGPATDFPKFDPEPESGD